MARPGGERDWWVWWCVDYPPECGGNDWCIRCTDLPANCTVCGKAIPKENKEVMTAEEVKEHGCEGGQQ